MGLSHDDWSNLFCLDERRRLDRLNDWSWLRGVHNWCNVERSDNHRRVNWRSYGVDWRNNNGLYQWLSDGGVYNRLNNVDRSSVNWSNDGGVYNWWCNVDGSGVDWSNNRCVVHLRPSDHLEGRRILVVAARVNDDDYQTLVVLGNSLGW